MRLINEATEREITSLTTIRCVAGPLTGQAWRYEKIIVREGNGHRVHCTRSDRRLGRIHREFHPSVFGCRVEREITFRIHIVNLAHHARSKFDDYLLAGIIALIPLAVFEHYQGPEKFFEFLHALLGR